MTLRISITVISRHYVYFLLALKFDGTLNNNIIALKINLRMNMTPFTSDIIRFN